MSLAIVQQTAIPLLLERNGRLVQVIKERDDTQGGLLADRILSSWQKTRLYDGGSRLFKSTAFAELALS